VVKRVGTPVYQAAARCVVGLPGPRIFANSPPKAGTHVLSTLLRRLPKVLFSGRHHSLAEFRGPDQDGPEGEPEFLWDNIRASYGRVRPGQFATGHFPAHPQFVDLLRDLDMRSIVIFRDPRDMVVSTAFYIRSLPRHPLHEVYRNFPTVSDAITAAILGVGPGPAGGGHPPVGQRLASYAPWLDEADVLTVRFEDLVGEHGGGSRQAQLTTVAAIAAHIDRPLDEAALRRVCDRVFSTSSATFRKGQIGDWRNHFTAEQVELFKHQAGDQLIRLGYESGFDW
jgi:hypothetical protein